MIKFLGRAWRAELADLASVAERSVLVAAPYIKYEEAVWFCQQLRPGIEITTLTNIDPDAVSSSTLDIAALHHLAEASPSARLIALPNLHAKVFIADDKSAIVTSGNLTRAALDRNIEYGVFVFRQDWVRSIKRDMLSFSRLGSPVGTNTLTKLSELESSLRHARANITDSALPAARRAFNEAIRQARPILASIQVGDRSSNAVFGQAIQYVLKDRPLPTVSIGQQVASLLPTLCDDTQELAINGQRYGKAWKHRLRNAQQDLKRRGVVTYDSSSRCWALTTAFRE